MPPAGRSDDVARLLADVDSADDDRELIDRFSAARQSLALDGETRTAFELEAIATGLTERVKAALARDAASTVKTHRGSPPEDHKRRMDAVADRVLEDIENG